MRTDKATGYVLWQGASRLDGAPVVAVATIKTSNRKTGPMVQTWILRQDVSPVEAVKSGADVSVCGDCRHRCNPDAGGARTCYVTIVQAPLSVWRKYRAGKYPVLSAEAVSTLHAGRTIRLGAYGDPAAVPVQVWQALTARAPKFTGYTHQWRRSPELSGLCMASVDSAEEKAQAKSGGFRTFRVLRAADALTTREILCPASDEAGKRTTCDRCGLCAGASRPAADVAILAHGAGAKSLRTV